MEHRAGPFAASGMDRTATSCDVGIQHDLWCWTGRVRISACEGGGYGLRGVFPHGASEVVEQQTLSMEAVRGSTSSCTSSEDEHGLGERTWDYVEVENPGELIETLRREHRGVEAAVERRAGEGSCGCC